MSVQAMTNVTSTIKRRRRTNAEVQQLGEQIMSVLAEDHPQSVRHVFYRMTDPRLPEPVEKSDRGYRHVQNRCKELRRSGRLPYHWITDATRRGYHVNTFANSADFVRQMARLYRADLWCQSDKHVEVWCESRSIAGVIEDDCNELAVSLYPCGGFASISLEHEACQEINGIVEQTRREPIIIYIGDYDPAGVLIDQSLRDELERHLHVPLEFIRLAITPEQIEQYDLPSNPRKAGDKRSLHVKEATEAEAMPANILRRLLRTAVESYLPGGALHAAKVAEKSEQQGLAILSRVMEERANG